MNKKLRCYLYTRVSTEMQVDGYSLEAQKERLIKEAQHRNMKIMNEYSDEGKSGKNVSGRPAFQQMLEDIRDGKDAVDYVLVFKLSRFGRNAADTLNSLQYMEDYNVNLLCVEDGIDSGGAAGKLMIAILAAVAEIERENIKEQTMAGRQQKARDGRWNGGFAPYGYKLVHKDGEKGKVLEINEKEAELVRVMFDKFVNTDMGANSVAKWLNDHGYTKTVRQNGTIPQISAHFVKIVLDNPVYMGKIAYGRRKTEKIAGTRNEFHIVKQADDAYEIYDGIHEAIVSEDMWYEAYAKRKLTGVKHEKTHSLEHCHILSGLVRCPVCGSKMYGVVNRKKKKGSDEFYKDMWYYKCKNRIKVEGHNCTYKTHIKQEQLNAEVIALLRWIVNTTDIKDEAASIAGNSDKDKLSELRDENNRLQSERKKVETKKKKLLAKIANMDVDDDLYDELCEDYMNIVHDYTEQIGQIDAKLSQNRVLTENAEKVELTMQHHYKALDKIMEHFEELAEEDQKMLMESFIERVEIFNNREEKGRWLKCVKLKFSIKKGDNESDEVWFVDTEDEVGENRVGFSYPCEQQLRRYVCCQEKTNKQLKSVEIKGFRAKNHYENVPGIPFLL